MTSMLQNFKIDGLHGHKTLDVQLRDNTLVIVGENGSGKTTFLRILFHFLSGRWISLIQFKFNYITATIDGVEYSIYHEDIVKSFKRLDGRFLAGLPPSIRKNIASLIDHGEFEKALNEVQRFGGRHALPTDEFFRQFDILWDSNKKHGTLQQTFQRVRESVDAQILYLPTYRRIERELSSIFEGANTAERKNKNRQSDSGDSYVELVEFGMQDVKRAIDNTLISIKEFARENLNNLTLRYLGDVVNQEYHQVGMRNITELSGETIKSVINRIDDNILSKQSKEHVLSVINSARTAWNPTEHDKIICHYFLKLHEFQQSLEKKEKQISDFCALCSEYIKDKIFSYDNVNFSFEITHKYSINSFEPIELSDLSSGEKQIVSLFSHLYLSGKERFFVLIDEPELSISVPWQGRFLNDILSGEFCSGLVAVTHSPFIYQNNLKEYTHSLGEFVSF